MKEATHKQNSVLFSFTLLKFWLCEPPHPTIREASNIIEKCFNWSKATGQDKEDIKKEIVKVVQKFFPDWNGDDLKKRYLKGKNGFAKNKKNGYYHKPESEQTEVKFSQEPTEKEPREPEPQEPTEKEKVIDDTIEDITARIQAGIRNIFLSGPAGCGKTTICQIVANKLDLPCVVVSCNAGTSPAEITGFKYPEPRHSAVTQALPIPGIIVFDEITTLDPAVGASTNALLANNKILSSMGEILRHKECTIISTSNTLGNGRDRQYISNNQLDAATMDRFTGGIIKVNYSEKYENNFDPDVKRYVNQLRKITTNNGIRKIVSTRSIIEGEKLKNAGLDWKKILIEHWTDDEKELIPGKALK